METLLNDIFTAQPDALLMIAGLAFIAVAILGSIKTYINPGKIGRIAAGAVGAILLIVGLVMYKPAPTPPSASVDEAVAKAGTAGSQATTTACYVPGKWPVEVGKQMTVGDSCTNAAGMPGKAVSVNPVCTYTSGPLAGTSQQLKHLMYVGFACQSPDHQSKGSVLPVAQR
jgi:hypothetical protein